MVTGVRTYGDGTGPAGETVGVDVAGGVSAGVGGKGMEGPGTSLAWLAGGSEGLLMGERLGLGLFMTGPEGLL